MDSGGAPRSAARRGEVCPRAPPLYDVPQVRRRGRKPAAATGIEAWRGDRARGIDLTGPGLGLTFSLHRTVATRPAIGPHRSMGRQNSHPPPHDGPASPRRAVTVGPEARRGSVTRVIALRPPERRRVTWAPESARSFQPAARLVERPRHHVVEVAFHGRRSVVVGVGEIAHHEHEPGFVAPDLGLHGGHGGSGTASPLSPST